MSETAKLLRHVVLVGFKPSVQSGDVSECARRFAELPKLVPDVLDFEWGTNVSPEGLANEHTHCFQMAFATEAMRDAYLEHPAHLAFVEQLRPNVERVTVIDYWTTSPDR